MVALKQLWLTGKKQIVNLLAALLTITYAVAPAPGIAAAPHGRIEKVDVRSCEVAMRPWVQRKARPEGGAIKIAVFYEIFSATVRQQIVGYNYDLVSPLGAGAGKVNEVTYQPSYYDVGSAAWVHFPDQFHHQYEYDAENRLVAAYTSTDSVYWEKDARYDYYRHGPLARTEIGHAKLQGLDYAYALPGWLKGLNSTRLLPGEDIGADGATAPTNGGNNVFARDAVGFGINYFLNDYAHINTAAARPFAVFFAVDSNTVKANSLYNGNIMAITTKYFEKLPQPGGNLGGQLGKELTKLYKYDQLNRLKTVNTLPDHTAGNTIFLYNSGRLDETFNFDANGNITSVQRAGMTSTTGAANMDNLTYHYSPNTNRLRHVTDAIGAGVFTTDLDNQVADNYRYDAIGNLIKDSAENIQKITWTVYGKIDSIYKTTGTIAYTYGPDGNRISQAVKVGANETTIWYVRDASGNVMSTYLKGDAAVNSGSLTLAETHLYGSSRLGILKPNTNVQSFTWPTPVNVTINGIAHYGKPTNFTRGKKFFEISNHLGNVLVSIADRKIPVANPSNPVLVSYYKPDIISATDYYAFGMQVPQRTFNSEKYRYGFNGKENDNEVKGTGNQQDYGMRIYDPRIGKFLSVDPLIKQYAYYSPYHFAGNRPICAIDLDGSEPDDVIGFMRARDTEKRIYETDPEHAEERIKEYKKHAFITVGSMLTAGNGALANAFFRGIMAYGAYEVGSGLVKKDAKELDEGVKTLAVGALGEMGGVLVGKVLGVISSKLSPIIKEISTTLEKSFCFVAGTKVLTNKGLINIESIKIGDSVWACNEITKEVALKNVESTSKRISNQLVRIEVGKEVIWTTPEHPFWINSAWVQAKEIHIGDSLTLFSKSKSLVTARSLFDSSVTVYNFAVSEFHTYFVSGLSVLVHNVCVGVLGSSTIEGTELLVGQMFKNESNLTVNIQMIYKEEGYQGKVFENLLTHIKGVANKNGTTSLEVVFESVSGKSTIQMYKDMAKEYGFQFSSKKNPIGGGTLDITWSK